MNELNRKKIEAMNFKKIGLNYIGKIDDFYFSVEDKNDSENELLISISLEDNSRKSTLFEFFDSLKEKDEIKDYSFDKNKIFVIFKESENSDLEAFLMDYAEKLKNIEASCICEYCNNTQNLSYYTNNSVYTLLCEECGKKLMIKYEEDLNKKSNYVPGFAASLVGAFIGSILWIIIGSVGFVASIAGYAIAFCAFKGYEIAKGKLSRFGIVLNIITILLAFFFAQYMGLFISVHKLQPEISFSTFLIMTPYLFSDIQVIKELLPNFGLGLLFAFLGTYRTIISHFRSAKRNDEFSISKVEL